MGAANNAPLKLCPRGATPRREPASKRLQCTSPPSLVNRHTTLLIGVPSSPSVKGRRRRDAIRGAWMRDPLVGRDVVVCFILSSATPQPQLASLREEGEAHRDMLLVDAPETPWLITRPTAYSNFTKRGRGMPTFKQHRFFQHAAATWPRVPFVWR